MCGSVCSRWRGHHWGRICTGRRPPNAVLWCMGSWARAVQVGGRHVHRRHSGRWGEGDEPSSLVGTAAHRACNACMGSCATSDMGGAALQGCPALQGCHALRVCLSCGALADRVDACSS